MRGKIVLILLVAITAALFITCDALSAHWGKTGQRVSLVGMVLAAPLGFLVFGYLNREYQLALVSGWVNVTVAIGTVLVGVLCFGDQLTVRQWLGLALAFIALILLLT